VLIRSVAVAVTLPTALRPAVPMTVPFAKNTTVPVGTLFCDPETVAVTATSVPRVVVEGAAVTAVVVARVFVPDACTVCAKAGDTLGGILALPAKRAVSACPPTPSADVVNVALVPAIDALPRSVAASKNWTVPLIVPAGPDTPAVNVTACPEFDGFADDETVTVDEAAAVLTVRVAVDELPVKVLSPEYVAVSVRVPAGSPAVVSDTGPSVTATDPMSVAPSKNCR